MKINNIINKNTVMRVNAIISLVITLGFLCIMYMNYGSYGAVVRDDIENISKLSALSLYAKVDNDLTKPVFVSSTMAADTFLKRWLRDEETQNDAPEHQRLLIEYLKALEKHYNYNSVFLVSSKSNRYYHFEGLHKVISRQNAHDVWYYNFLAMDRKWALDVDVDEADNNALTVFVNCRIEDDDGSLMGVVGVGIKMYDLQKTLGEYEQEFELQAFLVNKEGLVQAHSNGELIEKANLFTLLPVAELRERILGNRETSEIHWYPQKSLDHCLITHYVKSMDWYLVVEKNTQRLRNVLFVQLKQDAAVVFVILLILLVVSTRMVLKFNRTIVEKTMTDELTRLSNRHAFNEFFAGRLGSFESQSDQSLFILDVDNFKVVNDTSGHLFGDSVLIFVAEQLRSRLGSSAYLARWGGDEFVGLLPLPFEKAAELLNEVSTSIARKSSSTGCDLTVSIGITQLKSGDGIDSALLRADNAMYQSKARGNGLVTVF